jgi:hypothetical protein
MRTWLIFGFFLTIAPFCQAQQQLTDVYIQLYAIAHAGEPYILRVETGKVKSPLLDSLIDKAALKVWIKKMDSPVDVLNKLSLQGWTLVQVVVVPYDESGKADCQYLLKKQLLLSPAETARLNASYGNPTLKE